MLAVGPDMDPALGIFTNGLEKHVGPAVTLTDTVGAPDGGEWQRDRVALVSSEQKGAYSLAVSEPQSGGDGLTVANT